MSKGKYEVHQCGFDIYSESLLNKIFKECLRTTRLAVMTTVVG